MKRTSQQGFTLIEILVVVAIIAVLAGMIGPKLFGNVEKSQQQTVRADLKTIKNALDRYKLDNFRYPTTEQGLQALVSKPSGDPVPKNYSSDGYLDGTPKDPWGNEYQYLQPGEHGAVDIYSLGADGTPGGEGADADIGNWEEQ